MELKELMAILKHAAETGALSALTQAGSFQKPVTKSEAFRLYGRSQVERWIMEGLIVPFASEGSVNKKFIDRKKLMAVAASSNRITYLPVADRRGRR